MRSSAPSTRSAWRRPDLLPVGRRCLRRRRLDASRTVATRASLVALLWLGAAACPGDGPSDRTPEGAVQLFVDAMRARSRDAAFALLAESSRRALEERARTASEQSGTEVTAAEMLAVERFVMRWELGRMTARVDGDRATVVVTGAEDSQRAEVALVREDSRWRVVLPID